MIIKLTYFRRSGSYIETGYLPFTEQMPLAEIIHQVRHLRDSLSLPNCPKAFQNCIVSIDTQDSFLNPYLLI